eukprot:403364389
MQQVRMMMGMNNHKHDNDVKSSKDAAQAAYEKSFEDLLGKAKVSDEEKRRRDDLVQEKIRMDQEAKEKYLKDKANVDSRKQQDFEDLLAGKKKATDDMTLGELFKEFYGKAKQVDTTKYVDGVKNSAASSLNSLSSKLNIRRSQVASKTSTKTEEQKPEENVQAEQVKKESVDQAADANLNQDQAQQTSQQAQSDKTASAAQDQEQKAEETQTEQEPQQQTEQQEQVKADPWHQRIKSGINERASSVSQAVEQKFPKLHSSTSKSVSYIAAVWKETFPNEQRQARDKLEQRRQKAIEQKQWEEQEAFGEEEYDKIPEWKRGSIVLSDQQEPEKKKGIFRRMTGKVADKIKQTDTAKQFQESEQYKQLQSIQNQYSEFRSALKEQVEETQNPFVQGTRRIADVVLTESSCARAIQEMQKYDPEFDLNNLAAEFQEIFKEFYCNYLSDNVEYLEKVCGNAGLAVTKSEVKRRQTEGWKYRYTDILDSGNVNFLGAMVQERGVPAFSFTIVTQEIDCKVSLKNEDEIKEGDDNRILQTTWRVVLSRHDDPDIALAGHYWEIVEFNKLGELQQIV